MSTRISSSPRFAALLRTFLLGCSVVCLLPATGLGQPGPETLYLANTGMIDGQGESVTDLYLVTLDELTQVADMQLLARLPIEQADALACSPDDAVCYLLAKYEAGPFPNGGALGVYNAISGDFEIVGQVIDSNGVIIPEVVLASFSPGPEGLLYVGSMATETIYTVDVDTGVATPVGDVEIDGSGTQVNLSGADLAFTADGRLYLWTNQAGGADAPPGLYELRFPVLPGDPFIGIYLGSGTDGSDPASHEFNGLAVRDNGLGSLVGANRFSELHEQALDGSDLALFTLMNQGNVSSHLSGDMHHSYDCFLDADLAATEIAPGQALEVDMSLVHNRPSDVAVPLHMWIEDDAGNVLFHKKTRRIDLAWGDRIANQVTIPIPAAAIPGEYTFVLGVDAMRQGKVTVEREFRVVAE